MTKLFNSLLILSLLLFGSTLSAQQRGEEVIKDSIQKALKSDFSRQRIIMISFEVNRRLLAFEGLKIKLEKIAQDRARINSITQRIAPWALMEGLNDKEIARIIVYMYKADQAGANFDDSEDLIPLVAKKEIPIKVFIAMVQYNRITKQADIPEEIRQIFLSEAYNKGFDGASIMAAAQGFLLAKTMGLDLNKTATALLRKIPPKGSRYSPRRLSEIVKKAINYRPAAINVSQTNNLINSITQTTVAVNQAQDNNVTSLQQIVQNSQQMNNVVASINKIQENNKINPAIQNQPGMIPDYKPQAQQQQITVSPTQTGDWRNLSKTRLKQASNPWIGTRYKWGGKTGPPRGPGVDCSGYTRLLLTDRKVGVPDVPHGSGNQARMGQTISRRQIRAGDILFFSASPRSSKITHVGVAISSSEFTHSCNRGVIYESMNANHWKVRYVKAIRIFRAVQP